MTHRIPQGFWVPGATPEAVHVEPPKTFSSDAYASGRITPAEPDESFAPAAPSATNVEWSIFVPDTYEPRFAYPLLVWLHGTGGTEDDVQDLMPEVSERNMFAVGLQGNRKLKSVEAHRYDWQVTSGRVNRMADSTYQIVCALRKLIHVHSEQVFLVGTDCGADMAMHLFLRNPDWYAGVAALDGAFPNLPNSLGNYRALPGKKMLLGRRADGSRDAIQASRVARLMHSAGLDVKLHTTDDDAHQPVDWLRRLNRWVLEGTGSPTLIY